jgi:hypothetical protein
VIVPLLFVFGAGGLGLWVRARAKKKKMLGKVPAEPKMPGGYVAWKRGSHYVFVEKADSPPEVEPPFTWGVVPAEAIDATATTLKVTDQGAILVAAGAPDYATAVHMAQRWMQGLLGNAPPAPAPGAGVAYGRAKGLITVVVGQAVAPPPPGATPQTWKPAPTVPPTFVWAIFASSFLRDNLTVEPNELDPNVLLGSGQASSYQEAVKAADEKASGISFALWGHKPPYGTAEMLLADAALRRRKKAQ